MGTNPPMGSDLVKALSNPFESAGHDCSRISGKSDCGMSECCACHTKTTGAESDNEVEINVETKENG